ncbi:BC1881 family protein [Acetoanaerobium noterae]|uniref:BC1881 family protein n=1 Tax=Acetoanaerobium noterae TaxID=745369 RepID=UPI003241F2C6
MGKVKLCEILTCDLVEELKKREGVTVQYAGPEDEINETIQGPAILLVVID